MRCVIGTLPLAIQTNALIKEPLVRVPGGLSANRNLSKLPYSRISDKWNGQLNVDSVSVRFLTFGVVTPLANQAMNR